ncbi:MAG: hypothetical protein KKB50_12535 [Planctomycetes bacterium]|nr:hypothetical protein [Planctomycetota bacterium]
MKRVDPKESGRPAASDMSGVSAREPLHFAVERFERVDLDLEQIARGLDLRRDRPAHERWFAAARELADALPRVMRPRAVFRVDEVQQFEPERLALASGAVYHGAIGRFLAHATLVATFVVTIGSALERLSRGWLRRGDVLRGTLADAIASEAAEATAGRCQDVVQAWAHQRGLEITPRYSPGYCGMDVQQQVPLFASLPGRIIGVWLTPSCLMVPVKSVSGLIGIGPAEKVSPAAYPCELCDYPDCMQRRAPHHRHAPGQPAE